MYKDITALNAHSIVIQTVTTQRLRSGLERALHTAVALRALLAQRDASRPDVANLGFDTVSGTRLRANGALALEGIESLRCVRG